MSGVRGRSDPPTGPRDHAAGPRVEHPRCPFCHDAVRPGDEDKQACGACMAWHHAACWGEHGGCAGCGAGAPVRARAPGVGAKGEDEGTSAEAAVVAPASSTRARPRTWALLGWALALALVGFVASAAVLAWIIQRDHVRYEAELEHELGPAPRAAPPLDPGWRAAFEATRDEAARDAILRRAAEAGDPGAMNLLGFRLLEGTGGPPDEAEAARWARRAAEAGHAEAMYGLGLLHEEGRGVPRDEGEAARWFRRAEAAGDTLARGRLERLLARRPDLR